MARRIAFGGLIVLAVGFAFEAREGLLTLGGYTMSTVEVLIIGMLGLWGGSLALERRLPVWPKPLGFVVLGWLAVLILSTVQAPAYQHEAWSFMWRVGLGVLTGWAAYDLVEDRPRPLFIAMTACGVVAAALGIAEVADVPGVVEFLSAFKYAQTRVGDVVRASGPTSYATILSMILEMTLPLALALLIEARRTWAKIALGVGVLIILAAIVLTLSRAGIVVAGLILVAFAAYGLYQGRTRLIVQGALGGTALAGLIGVVLLGNPLTALRLTTETEAAWYQATYDAPESIEGAAGEEITVPVTVTNTGPRPWHPDGEQFFALAYHLTDAQGEVVSYDGARTALPHTVQPGDSVTVQALVVIPAKPGTYRIEWDMVQEDVTWFSWKDVPVAVSSLDVSGAAASPNVLGTPAPDDVRNRQATPGRLDLWRAALLMAADRPLLGVGPDNFRWQYGPYAGVAEWDTNIHANNLYLEWLADTGIIGLGAFLLMSAAIFRPIITRLRAEPDIYLLAGGLALMAWYVHGFLDFFYEFTPTYVAFWLMVGLSVRMADHADRV